MNDDAIVNRWIGATNRYVVQFSNKPNGVPGAFQWKQWILASDHYSATQVAELMAKTLKVSVDNVELA